jgi:hypothetical protein
MSIDLKTASLQEIFDYGLAAIRKQGKRSANIHGCQYKTEDGLKCIVGHMLTDEQASWAALLRIGGVINTARLYVHRFFVPILETEEINDKARLLQSMQGAHDIDASTLKEKDYMAAFEKEMEQVASHFKLNYSKP